MSPFRALAPDQRAVLELLLRQSRSYAELSELLGIPEDAVRARAHGALATLAPDRPAPVGEDGAVADWILGQQDAAEAGRTRESVARVPAWRAWAADVAERLGEVDGAEVPDVPDAEDDAPASAPAPKAKPRKSAKAPAEQRRPRPVRDGAAAAAAAKPKPEPAPTPAPAAAAAGGGIALRSSKLGGALLLAALAIVVAIVLIFFVFDGDDGGGPPSGNASATATPTATPQVVREIVLQGDGNRAQGLMRVFRREEDGSLVFALAADNVPQNRRNEVYAVWFTKQGGTPRNLGFSQTRVGQEGVFTTGGPQEGQEADFARWLTEYDTVVVARASSDSASSRRPGKVVLRGRLPGGE